MKNEQLKETRKYNNYDDMLGEYPVAVTFTDLTKVYESVHWHNSIEINIVNNGSIDVQTNEETFTLNAGQGIILNQNVVHSLRPSASSEENAEEACTVYAVHFSPSFIFSYEQPFLGKKYREIVLNSSNLQKILLDENRSWDNDVLEVINSLIATNLTKRYGYEMLSRGYLCQLWALLLRKINPQDIRMDKPTVSLDSERVKMAITFIEEHYADPLSLDDIAGHVLISKSECCRCFKRSLRMTPFEYLMHYRIYIASLKIIENPDLKSISELGFSVGFNNSSYFNKIFKQFLNCTPSEYRKKVKAAGTGPNGVSAFKPYRF